MRRSAPGGRLRELFGGRILRAVLELEVRAAMTGRLLKIVMCLALGLYAGLAAADNLWDYGANYAFVQHVMSMDTTHDGVARVRAVTDPRLWRLAYGVIIAGEAATAALFWIAAVALWQARREPPTAFHAAKRWAYAAATVGFLVWFVGFEIGGGEWFAMWQSPRWNGQEPAFRFYMTLLAVLIFIGQADAEIRRDV